MMHVHGHQPSFNTMSVIFHPCSFCLSISSPAFSTPANLARHFPVLHFPALHFCPSFSSPAFSSPALLCIIFQSCIFLSCNFSRPHSVSRFSVRTYAIMQVHREPQWGLGNHYHGALSQPHSIGAEIAKGRKRGEGCPITIRLGV